MDVILVVHIRRGFGNDVFGGFSADPVIHVIGTIYANRGTTERSPYHDTSDDIGVNDDYLDHRNYPRARASDSLAKEYEVLRRKRNVLPVAHRRPVFNWMGIFGFHFPGIKFYRADYDWLRLRGHVREHLENETRMLPVRR